MAKKRSAKKATVAIKPGTVVKWCGSAGEWTVIQWQPHNGIDGSYWLKNRRGVNATAGRDEVAVISHATKATKKA